MTIESEVLARVDSLRPAITDFIQRLVRFRSLPGEEQEAQHFIADKLRSLACDVTILKSDFSELATHPAFCDDGISFENRLSVVGTWAGSSNGRSLILNGHMDVVPTGAPALWKFPPGTPSSKMASCTDAAHAT